MLLKGAYCVGEHFVALQCLMFGCSWAHRGSTAGFLKLGLSESRAPFSLFQHSELI